jgi:predicted RNA binding protein YcfA (HicA-like mRNA interferase family)
MDIPKLANCMPQDVIKALKKLGGFSVDEAGSKHIIVKHTASGKKSTIPREKPVNKNLLRDFVEDYLVKELGYLEKDIYKHLWC